MIGCGPVSSPRALPGAVQTRVDLGGHQARILGGVILFHARAYIPVRPAAPADEAQKAFLDGDVAVGVAGSAAGVGVEVASAGVDRGALEAFLGVAPMGAGSVRIDRVEVVDSLRERSDCT